VNVDGEAIITRNTKNISYVSIRTAELFVAVTIVCSFVLFNLAAPFSIFEKQTDLTDWHDGTLCRLFTMNIVTSLMSLEKNTPKCHHTQSMVIFKTAANS
jgi:hypothetical protein